MVGDAIKVADDLVDSRGLDEALLKDRLQEGVVVV
jgi:hypothetical protein